MRDVFNEIRRIEREMGILSERQCLALVPKSNEALEETFRLPIGNAYETESSVVATFELPGVNKEDIELNVEENRIEVKVESKAEEKAEEKGMESYEMRKHSFYGAIPLPAEVAAENADATYKNGILRVEIPKAKKQDRKRIEIK